MSDRNFTQNHENNPETSDPVGAELTQPRSRDVLEQTRRDLIALRVKHGATSPIGCRCSNIVELLQVPELPRYLIARQMADLARLTRAFQ